MMYIFFSMQPCASMPDGPAEPVVLNPECSRSYGASINRVKDNRVDRLGIGIYDAFCLWLVWNLYLYLFYSLLFPVC